MQRMLVLSLTMLLVLLSACAGGKSDAQTPADAPFDRGDLLPIERQHLQVTVQPEINMLLMRSMVSIPAGYSDENDSGLFMLHKDAYIESMTMNNIVVEPHELGVIKTKYFPGSITDSDWDRITEFASLYRVDMPRHDGEGPHYLEIEYSLRVTEEMTCCELGEDEFILDGIGFLHPSNLENDYQFYIEVTHPSKFFVELLDNSAASEEVTPTMSRTDFTVSGLTDPLLIIGTVQQR